MGAYITTRCAVAIGTIWLSFLMAGFFVFLAKISAKLEENSTKLREIEKNVSDANKIQKMLDSTISLAQSVKGNTNVEVAGGNANER